MLFLPQELLKIIATNVEKYEDGGTSLYSFRLTCKMFRDIIPKRKTTHRLGFYKTPQLLEVVWNEPKFQITNYNIWVCAVENTNVAVLDWLYERIPFEPSHYLVVIAVEHNSLDVLKWLYARNCPLNNDIFFTPIFNKNNEMLNWLIKHGIGAEFAITFPL